MKIMKLLVIAFFVICGILPKTIISNGYDYSSTSITIENDEAATLENLYPVIILKNNTNKDLTVTYDFYVYSKDSQEFNADILIKSNERIVLELPQLKHLGTTGESRRVWFSWSEENKLKPAQGQIDTFIFKTPQVPNIDKPPIELGIYSK